VPLSRDPERRARQLANLHPPKGSEAEARQKAGLKRGSESSGTPKLGEARRLLHGARTRRPQNGPEWSPAVQAAVADLEARVGVELRGEDGSLLPWAVPSIEAVAIARVTALRNERWVATREAQGTVTGQDFALQAKVTSAYHHALAQEGLTLRSRLEAQAQAFDLARYWADNTPGGVIHRERRV
jgi:hypothetical protein